MDNQAEGTLESDRWKHNPKRLLNPEELAERIGVKRTWVYARTRLSDCGGMPVIWVGRYPRFDLDEVMKWLRAQRPR